MYYMAMSAKDDNGEICGIYLMKIKADKKEEALEKANKYIEDYNKETDEGIQMYIETIENIGNIGLIE